LWVKGNSKLKKVIDVWLGKLVKATVNHDYWVLLNEVEKIKATSIKLAIQRAQYIEVRAKLRWVLANYINAKPEQLIFAQEKHGKPYLLEHSHCHFNLSHSGDQLAIAVAQHYPVGIDVEQWKQKADYQALVKRCFAEEEQAYWRSLPDEHKKSEFYRFWTRKEAFVKATGRGIGLGLDRCVILAEKPTEFLRVPFEYGPASEWEILDLDFPGGYSGALVARACGFEVRIHQLNRI
jgi:4'-phosphopantetheinyl transferase